MTTWLVVLGAAGCSYLLRISMVVALAGRPLPAPVAARLPLVGPAALGALVAGAVTAGVAAGAPAVHAGPALAVGAALLVVRRTRRPADALIVGLPLAALAAVAGW